MSCYMAVWDFLCVYFMKHALHLLSVSHLFILHVAQYFPVHPCSAPRWPRLCEGLAVELKAFSVIPVAWTLKHTAHLYKQTYVRTHLCKHCSTLPKQTSKCNATCITKSVGRQKERKEKERRVLENTTDDPGIQMWFNSTRHSIVISHLWARLGFFLYQCQNENVKGSL